MIKVNSNVKLNIDFIHELTENQTVALEQTAELLHGEVVQAQVVPRMRGTLQGEAFAIDRSQSANGIVSLVHSTPYARRLYFNPEYNFHQEPWTDTDGKKYDGNPNAKGKWFEDWMAGGKESEFAINAFKKIYRRLCGL